MVLCQRCNRNWEDKVKRIQKLNKKLAVLYNRCNRKWESKVKRILKFNKK